MFLKFLDDLELQREAGPALRKEIQARMNPYRWRDWAASPTASQATSSWPSSTTRRPLARTAKKGRRAYSVTCAPHQLQRRRQAHVHRHLVQGRTEPDGQRYLLPRCHQQTERHPLTSSDELHSWEPCRIHAPEIATAPATPASFMPRRGRRPLHGHRHRPAPRRNRPRPARARWLSWSKPTTTSAT